MSACYGYIVQRFQKDIPKFSVTQPSCFIGSDNNCNYVVAGQNIGPEHCLITSNQHRAIIRPINKAFPVLVENKKIDFNGAILKHGDSILIGSKEFRWEYSNPNHKRLMRRRTENVADIIKNHKNANNEKRSQSLIFRQRNNRSKLLSSKTISPRTPRIIVDDVTSNEPLSKNYRTPRNLSVIKKDSTLKSSRRMKINQRLVSVTPASCASSGKKLRNTIYDETAYSPSDTIRTIGAPYESNNETCISPANTTCSIADTTYNEENGLSFGNLSTLANTTCDAASIITHRPSHASDAFHNTANTSQASIGSMFTIPNNWGADDDTLVRSPVEGEIRPSRVNVHFKDNMDILSPTSKKSSNACSSINIVVSPKTGDKLRNKNKSTGKSIPEIIITSPSKKGVLSGKKDVNNAESTTKTVVFKIPIFKATKKGPSTNKSCSRYSRTEMKVSRFSHQLRCFSVGVKCSISSVIPPFSVNKRSSIKSTSLIPRRTLGGIVKRLSFIETPANDSSYGQIEGVAKLPKMTKIIPLVRGSVTDSKIKNVSTDIENLSSNKKSSKSDKLDPVIGDETSNLENISRNKESSERVILDDETLENKFHNKKSSNTIVSASIIKDESIQMENLRTNVIDSKIGDAVSYVENMSHKNRSSRSVLDSIIEDEPVREKTLSHKKRSRTVVLDSIIDESVREKNMSHKKRSSKSVVSDSIIEDESVQDKNLPHKKKSCKRAISDSIIEDEPVQEKNVSHKNTSSTSVIMDSITDEHIQDKNRSLKKSSSKSVVSDSIIEDESVQDKNLPHKKKSCKRAISDSIIEDEPVQEKNVSHKNTSSTSVVQEKNVSHKNTLSTSVIKDSITDEHIQDKNRSLKKSSSKSVVSDSIQPSHASDAFHNTANTSQASIGSMFTIANNWGADDDTLVRSPVEGEIRPSRVNVHFKDNMDILSPTSKKSSNACSSINIVVSPKTGDKLCNKNKSTGKSIPEIIITSPSKKGVLSGKKDVNNAESTTKTVVFKIPIFKATKKGPSTNKSCSRYSRTEMKVSRFSHQLRCFSVGVKCSISSVIPPFSVNKRSSIKSTSLIPRRTLGGIVKRLSFIETPANDSSYGQIEGVAKLPKMTKIIPLVRGSVTDSKIKNVSTDIENLSSNKKSSKSDKLDPVIGDETSNLENISRNKESSERVILDDETLENKFHNKKSSNTIVSASIIKDESIQMENHYFN